MSCCCEFFFFFFCEEAPVTSDRPGCCFGARPHKEDARGCVGHFFFRSRLYLYPQTVYWLHKMQAVSHKHSLGEVPESWMLILVCNGGLNPEPCDSHLQPGQQNQSIKASDECDRSRAPCVVASRVPCLQPKQKQGRIIARPNRRVTWRTLHRSARNKQLEGFSFQPEPQITRGD